MKLVETLVVRDEADIVETQIRHHLNLGVDFVIATDHGSVDGTTDILESYVRDGYLHRIAVEGELHDGLWRTQMARLASAEFGADWRSTPTRSSSGRRAARLSRNCLLTCLGRTG